MQHEGGLTPAQRTLRARIAAHALHAQGGTNTRPATTAFLARFERAVDPAGTLAPDERRRRAEHARKAYMGALALKASRARGSKREAAPAIVTPGAAAEARRAAGERPAAA